MTGARSTCSVLVVGAGPTGLMLALWLARRGVDVRIGDKAARAGTTSRALVLHARTLEFYQQLGLADTMLAHARKFDGVRLWVHGRCRGEIVLGDIGKGASPFPYMLILPQDVQERLLVEALRAVGVEVERSVELTGFVQRLDGVDATLRAADGSTRSCACAWLAGCDGAHSTVRHGLGVGFPGAQYAHLFYVADVDARGPVVNDKLDLALDSADFLAVFPLVGEDRARLIGTIDTAVEAEPPGGLGWDDVSRGILARLPIEVQQVNWFSTYHVHHRVAAQFREGRAFLLGDAAHIHSPVGGQGMNTGLGDAVNLAWKLAMVVQGRADARLLDTYAPERRAFALRLVATTDRAFTFVTRTGRLAAAMREHVVPTVLPRLLRLDALRRLMFRTVSQIGIEYRASALSAGRAGALQGGDRLPWTGDNYAPLASLAWQVHQYGSPADPGIAQACGALGLPLHVFAHESLAPGVPSGTSCLVRPDGYVGFADRAADPAALREYCASHALKFA
jgi:2-polyprenyl-6-methoxyphenol hydroxylase-like FAD-dependent oxidoreductase